MCSVLPEVIRSAPQIEESAAVLGPKQPKVGSAEERQDCVYVLVYIYTCQFSMYV